MLYRMNKHKPSALVVDPDLDVATLTTAILNDDGFIATILTDFSSVAEVVALLEPDVILMDIKGYGDEAAWDAVEWLGNRPNVIPIVMFTTSEEMAKTVGITNQRKEFVTVVPKPFNLPQLLEKLHEVVAERIPLPKVFHGKPTISISDLLRKRVVKDLREVPDREWAMFHDNRGALVQIYWWETANAYCIRRMVPGQDYLEDLGKTKTAEEAVERALGAS